MPALVEYVRSMAGALLCRLDQCFRFRSYRRAKWSWRNARWSESNQGFKDLIFDEFGGFYIPHPYRNCLVVSSRAQQLPPLTPDRDQAGLHNNESTARPLSRMSTSSTSILHRGSYVHYFTLASHSWINLLFPQRRTVQYDYSGSVWSQEWPAPTCRIPMGHMRNPMAQRVGISIVGEMRCSRRQIKNKSICLALDQFQSLILSRLGAIAFG